jgi:hypothetical protein
MRPSERRKTQRSAEVIAHGIHIRASLNKNVDHILMAALYRSMESRET